MAEEHDQELTREGLLVSLAGKAKEAAGEIVGNEELAEAGRQQQTDAEELGDESPAAPSDAEQTP